MLFSKRLAPAPPLALCLEATIQGRGPSFQAELIPVRSPLLRESYLVPFPPLTYMLKFSGFADLTSCLGLTRTGLTAVAMCHRAQEREPVRFRLPMADQPLHSMRQDTKP